MARSRPSYEPSLAGVHTVRMSRRLTKKSFVKWPGVSVKTPSCERPVLASSTRRPATSTAISVEVVGEIAVSGYVVGSVPKLVVHQVEVGS